MSFSQFHRFYGQADFAALGSGSVNFPVLQANIIAATTAEPPSIIEQTSISSVHLVWDPGAPAQAVLDAADAVVAAHTGSPTTSAPFVATNNGPVTASNATAVTVIDLTTTPLDAGTYHLDFSSQYRLQALVNGEAARAISIVTINGGAPRTQQDHWDGNVVAAYNGSATFNVNAGATVRVQLQIAEVGPGAGVAEMTLARVTVDKVG